MKIWHRWMTGIVCGLLLLPMGLAAAEEPLPQAARTTLEQSLEGDVQDQVMFAQDGLIIRNQILLDGRLKIQYPKVRVVGKKDVSQKISRYFTKRAKQSQEHFKKADRGQEKLTSRLGYVLSYHGPRYLSIIEYSFSYYERAAHPSSWEHGVTFDLTTGDVVPWQQVVARKNKRKFTLENINKALWATEYGQGGYFFSDFTGLKQLPTNYYVDSEGYICFVFNQYEIAPYAAGIINLNMGVGL